MMHYTELAEYFPSIEVCGEGKRKSKEVTDILTFDIETTSIWEIVGNITAYDDTYSEKQLNESPHKAFCWLWQVGINDIVYYGRELHQFVEFLQNVLMKNTNNAHIIIWVHNLSFEFNFLREYLEEIAPIEVFARTPRTPIKFNWGGIEFRCSYMLTRKSLESWGNELGIPKLVGVFDYDEIRTPLTPLTPDLEEYAERDCTIVFRGIQEFVKEYGSQKNIPLTQTGRVRRVVRKKAEGNTAYNRKITRLQPSTPDMYKLFKGAFAGGSTGSNYLNSDKICEKVGSKDIASDYPYQMIAQKYPMTPFHKVSVSKKTDFEKFAYIFALKITNLSAKNSNHYIPSSKCLSLKRAVLDNGKLVSASSFIYICTEQDFLIIKDFYNFDFEIFELWQSKKDYLPSFYVDYILTLYEKKTKLKGVKGKEDEYKRSKEFINSLYGMMVTDFIQPEITYDMDWITTPVNISSALEEMHEKFYKNFVAYQWGVWVTAYARRLLWRVILEMGADHVYHDTDSSKDLHPERHEDFFEKINEEIIEKAKKAMEHHGFSYDRIAPLDIKGNPHPIGVFETEKTYKAFKTLGAKKYCYTYDGKNIACTISGVPKSNAIALETLDDFKEGFEFPRTLRDPSTGAKIAKHLVTYVETEWCPTLPDGYVATQKYSTVIRPTTYRLGLTDDYKHLIFLGKQKNRL